MNNYKQIVMSKAVTGYEQLRRLKKRELEEYYLLHKEVLKPFLVMQKELQELNAKCFKVRMDIVDTFLKK